MANNRNCGCGARRGCLNSVRGARWDNYPYYNGVCPDVEGEYVEVRDEGWNDNCCRNRDDGCGERRGCRRRRRDGDCFGMFLANVPMVVAANGVVPLINGHGCGKDFCVNSGQITVEDAGIYLATYTARAPETMEAETTLTLNVNEVSQPCAITTLAAGSTVTGQAIFNACENSVVSLRTSEAISATDPSLQPMVTLSLVQLE